MAVVGLGLKLWPALLPFLQQDFDILLGTTAAKYVTTSPIPTITLDTIRKWRSKFSNVDNIFWMGKPAAMKLLEQYTGLPMVDATVLKDKAVHQLAQNITKRRDMILSWESSSKRSALLLAVLKTI